jgi:serine/threonine protein kinase
MIKLLVLGIAEIHKEDIVHRDIHFDNIFVDKLIDGNIILKIGDFGMHFFLDFWI